MRLFTLLSLAVGLGFGLVACAEADTKSDQIDDEVNTETLGQAMTFASDVYHVTSFELQSKMAASSYGNVRFADWCRLDSTANYSEYELYSLGLTESCHTQGNSVRGNRLVVACQGTSGTKSGWVQSFYKSGSGPAGSAKAIYSGGQNHPNVGNGITVTDGASKYDLYPIVNAGTDSYVSDPTLVELRRYTDHSRSCGFSHGIRDSKGRSSLGAVSAITVNSNTYLAACGYECDEFYVYRLAHPASGDCGATLERRLVARGNAADTSPITDSGAGDSNWGYYNGVALIANHLGQVFMIGTHQKFMDTWRIDNFGTASPYAYRKLDKFKWDGTNPVDGHYYFKQGLGIQYIDEHKFGIWLSPHDFWTNSAGRYVRLYRCIRQF